MKTYRVPVQWSMCGFVEVEANSKEEAIENVVENPDIGSPENGEYLDDSWQVFGEETEVVKKGK